MAEELEPSSGVAGESDFGGGGAPTRVYLEASRHFLDLQISTDDKFDTRNSTVLSIGSTVLPVTFGLLNLADRSIPHRAEIALLSALAAYVCLVLCSWWASQIRGMEFRPALEPLATLVTHLDTPGLEDWVAQEYAHSAAENRESLNKKARWVGAANTCLCAEALLLSLAALWTLL